jgi:hypothetical protein
MDAVMSATHIQIYSAITVLGTSVKNTEWNDPLKEPSKNLSSAKIVRSRKNSLSGQNERLEILNCRKVLLIKEGINRKIHNP